MADQLEGTVMFYRKPEPLSVQAHGTLRIRTADKPYGFAASNPSVPLLVGEFASAVTDYPIIFVGPQRMPVAMTGLPHINGEKGGNLFIDAQGKHPANVYIPAFIRRYPFVAAADKANPNSIIACLDVEAENISTTEGTPVFENGEPSAFTLGCVNFLERFEGGRRATEDIVAVWADMELFETRTFEVGVNGAERKPIVTYQTLSREKLDGLSQARLGKLQDIGGLAPAYAQTFSLNNWMKVLQRALDNGSLTPKA